MSDKKRIYLDHAASTPLRAEVREKMEPYWSEMFANAQGFHEEGRLARKAIEEARGHIAKSFNAHDEEVIFTSGGTESNNIAVFGLYYKMLEKGFRPEDLHFITTEVEHSSVKDCYEKLKGHGAGVTYISVDEYGVVDPKEVRDAVTEKTVLVSIMFANNEIGSVQPIGEIGKLLLPLKKERKDLPLYFHTDAIQVSLFFDCNVQKLHTDLLSIDGQKIYGPKGSGALYVKRDIEIGSIFCGGSQERGLRPGTPPTPLVVGLGEAVRLAFAEREQTSEDRAKLRDYFIAEVEKHIPEASINGPRENRLPNNIHFSFPGHDGEFLVIALNEHGIAVSSRSACLGKGSGSYVVSSTGKDEAHAKGTIRFTIGKSTTKEDLDEVVSVLQKILKKA